MAIIETVEVEVEVNTQKLEKGFNKASVFAQKERDRLNSQMGIQLNFNVLKLEGDLKKIKRRIQKAQTNKDFNAVLRLEIEEKKLRKQLQTARKEFKNFAERGNKTVSGIGQRFRELGKIIVATFAFRQIVDFGKKLLTLGSDLEEITSKFNTVFKGMETEAKATFDNIGLAVGRSRLEMIDFGASLADVLKPLGFTTGEALKLSENMTKLAIDVASFNNVSDAQAINSFKSALTGERESLKSLGIVINEADLKTEAYTAGIAKQGETLTKQQKALATYNLLLKNTSDAQGDAVRTGGSFANQLKRLQGVIKDVLAESGADIAKQSSSILTTLSNFITEYGSKIIKVQINTVKTLLGIFVEAGKGFKGLFDLLTNNTNQAIDNQLTFTTIILNFINIINAGLNTIVTVVKSIGAVIGGLFMSLGSSILDTGRQIVTIVKGIGGAIKGLVTGDFSLMKKSIKELQDTAKKGVQFRIDTGNTVVEEIKSNFGDLSKNLFKNFNDINRKSKSSNKDLKSNYETTFDDLGNIINKYSKDIPVIISKASSTTGKLLNDISKKEEKLNNEREERLRITLKKKTDNQIKLAKVAQKEIDTGIKEGEKVIKDYQDEIEKTGDEFTKLKEKAIQDIADINKELGNIETTGTTNIASRAVEVQNRLDEIKGMNLTSDLLEERIKLEKELKLAKENVSIEDIKNAKIQSELSPVELILQEIEAEKSKLEAKKLQIETELLLAENQKNKEIEILSIKVLEEQKLIEDLAILRVKTEQFVTERLKEEVNKQITSTDKLIERIKRLIELKRQAGLSSSIDTPNVSSSNSSGTSNTNNNTSNVNVNLGGVTVNNEADEDRLVNKIKTSIIEDKRNGEKNIL